MKKKLLTIFLLNLSLIAFGQKDEQKIFGFRFTNSSIGFIWHNVYETKLDFNEIKNILSKYKGHFKDIEISENTIHGRIENIDVEDMMSGKRRYNFSTSSSFLENIGIQSHFILQAREGKYRITISKIEFKMKNSILEYNRFNPEKLEQIISTNQIINLENYEKKMNIKTGFFAPNIDSESIVFFGNIDKTFRNLFDLQSIAEIDSEDW